MASDKQKKADWVIGAQGKSTEWGTPVMEAQGYKDLIVWQKGILLVKEIYQRTQSFPKDERFGLVSQMRRAAVSIPSNIAEGQARRSTNEFVHFISIAEGSVAELETQLIIACELAFLPKDDATLAFGFLEELRKMLNALRRKLGP